jgi:hypothetical protein
LKASASRPAGAKALVRSVAFDHAAEQAQDAVLVDRRDLGEAVVDRRSALRDRLLAVAFARGIVHRVEQAIRPRVDVRRAAQRVDHGDQAE